MKKNNFCLIDGYSFFPTHSYTFVQNNELEWREPWFYDLKYRDLRLPLFIDDNKVIGFEKVYPGQKIFIDSKFYYFIQSF